MINVAPPALVTRFYNRTAKRLLDASLAATALVLLSPVLALVALVVRIAMGAPVLFRQQRPGRHGVPFTILKFRTMRQDGGADGPSADSARLDTVGRFLRRSSLDELPQLFNVLKGEMSLVGPRPLLMQYLDRYTPEQARRHDVRPGVTGWAQVNGRNALPWEDKLAMDVWYVDHQSPWVDLTILARTFGSVLRGRGVSQPGHATVREFRGSEP
jgi:sugar transferase EpsL